MDEPSLALLVEHWPLFRDPILAALIAGAVLGWLGVFVVLRRMVFVTAAVSQAAGLGVALAFLGQIVVGGWLDRQWQSGAWTVDAAHDWHHRVEVLLHPIVGAAALSLAAALLFTVRPDRLRISRESLLGFAYVGAGAAAVVVGDRIAQEAHDIGAILFGTAVLVRGTDLAMVAGVGLLVAIVQIVGHRGFVFAAFDPEGARVQGLPVRALDTAMWVLVALMVSVATRALGALPVFAFAVLPGMAALMATSSLRAALPLAALFGASAGGGGYLLSFFADLPVGASQTLAAASLVLITLPIRLARGPG